MHILWTPSWYPTAEHPLNGSFFAEQVGMLKDGGHRVGVMLVDPVSAWANAPHLHATHVDGQVLRRAVRTVPLGILPGDLCLIRAQARHMAEEYHDNFGRPDVIHAHSAFPGLFLAKALSELWRVPFGFTEHRPSSLERHTWSPRYRQIRAALTQSSFTATVSTEMAEKLTAYYGVSPFEAIPLPCGEAFFQEPLHRFSTDSFTFVHVSNMDRNKRTEETIAAFAKVVSAYPDARLLLIGGSTEVISELTPFARGLGIPNANIEFTGPVARERIAQEMARGDCLVLVSEFEAGGTVFSEAMALSLPIIASATAAGKFAVTPDTGILVPIDDQEALVSAMTGMIETSRCGGIDPAVIRAHAYGRSSAEAFVAAHTRMYEAAVRA